MKRKRMISSSEDSSHSDDSNSDILNYGTHSKEEQFDVASCSRTNDSDSNISDDVPPKSKQRFENNEKDGNKGMSLMVITCLRLDRQIFFYNS